MVNQSVTEKLRELAETVGVSTGFWDWYGNWKHVEDASLIAVLKQKFLSMFRTEWACGATLRPKMDITMNLSS